ncbi:MAG: bifunctional metallophosphatase/5'-nucleotidase [Actinomycetes bacterium]
MSTTVPRMRRLTLTGLASTSLIASALAPAVAGGHVDPGSRAATAPGKPVEIQILSVSDFHGQLDPLNVFGVGQVGGAAALSAYFDQEREANPNTLLFTAGDAVGATPPLSSFFEDAPTIEWMNRAGFTADTLGNHNFDAGLERLNDQVADADFDYLSANLDDPQGELEGVAPYEVYEVAGVDVAVIGITNPEAPSLVTPGNFGSITVTDPVAAAEQARDEAEAAGADVFVVLTHMGVVGEDAAGQPVGPLVDFARAVEGFDVILGDHTDAEFAAEINGALVVENESRGATYARTTLTVRPASGKVLDAGTEFVVPLVQNVTPDSEVDAWLDEIRGELAVLFDRDVADATEVLPRGGNIERLQEVAIGNVTTDALRETYGTQVAFTNGGGLRAPLPSSYAPLDTSLRRPVPGYASGPPFDIVVGDVYAMLPFGNEALTRTVTGAQLWDVLEHSVSSIPSANGKFLQISGFRFTYDATLPPGNRVVSVEFQDGTPIPDDAGVTITAATNNFTNAGGDGYTMLADGQGVTRDLLANVVLGYIDGKVLSNTVEGRIVRLS